MHKLLLVFYPVPVLTPQTFARVIFRFSILTWGIFLTGCGGGGDTSGAADNAAQDQVEAAKRSLEEEAAAMKTSKGLGPVKELTLGPLDEALAGKGKELFESKCIACHQVSDRKVVGPGLADVTRRRNPEWIMNMIVNPEEMTKKDPLARQLLEEHLTQMTNQNVTETDARAMLEYLRKNDGAK